MALGAPKPSSRSPKPKIPRTCHVDAVARAAEVLVQQQGRLRGRQLLLPDARRGGQQQAPAAADDRRQLLVQV